MSRRAWTFLGLGGLAAGLSVAAAAGPLEAERPADLSAEVRALRERVETLEKQLGALESGGLTVTIPPQAAQTLPPPPGGGLAPLQFAPQVPAPLPGDMPPGTQRREFNGMSYYLIPIAEGGSAATGQATQTLATPAP